MTHGQKALDPARQQVILPEYTEVLEQYMSLIKTGLVQDWIARNPCTSLNPRAIICTAVDEYAAEIEALMEFE